MVDVVLWVKIVYLVVVVYLVICSVVFEVVIIWVQVNFVVEVWDKVVEVDMIVCLMGVVVKELSFVVVVVMI